MNPGTPFDPNSPMSARRSHPPDNTPELSEKILNKMLDDIAASRDAVEHLIVDPRVFGYRMWFSDDDLRPIVVAILIDDLYDRLEDIP